MKTRKCFVIVQNEKETNYRLDSCKRFFVKKRTFTQYGNPSWSLVFTDDIEKAKKYSSMERARKAFKSMTNGWFQIREVE